MGEKKRTLPQRKTGTAGIVSALRGVLIHGCLQLDFTIRSGGYGVDGAHRSFLVLAHGKRNRRKRRVGSAGV